MSRPLTEHLLGLLADTTSEFISCPVSDIDRAIDRSLAAMGRLFDVDRVSLFMFFDGHRYTRNTHEWCAPGIEPAIQDQQALPCDAMPWWISEMRAGRCVNIASLADLPEMASYERNLLVSQGIESLLEVPMFWNHRLEGFAGFDHVRSARVWTPEEIGVLRIIVNSIAQLIERRRREDVERRLHQTAYHDALTEIPNRLLLVERLGGALAQRRGLTACCFIDLDGFKPVNDSHGHEAGDRLLVEIARRLSHGVRACDTVARLGGDEFAVVLTGLRSRAEGLALVERIACGLAEPVELPSGVRLTVGASIGIRFTSPDDVDAGTVLREADAAMYAAKAARNGAPVVFEQGAHASGRCEPLGTDPHRVAHPA